MWPNPWEKENSSCLEARAVPERRERGRVWSLGTLSWARLIGKGSGGRDLLGPSPLPAGAFIPRWIYKDPGAREPGRRRRMNYSCARQPREPSR